MFHIPAHKQARAKRPVPRGVLTHTDRALGIEVALLGLATVRVVDIDSGNLVMVRTHGSRRVALADYKRHVNALYRTPAGTAVTL